MAAGRVTWDKNTEPSNLPAQTKALPRAGVRLVVVVPRGADWCIYGSHIVLVHQNALPLSVPLVAPDLREQVARWAAGIERREG